VLDKYEEHRLRKVEFGGWLLTTIPLAVGIVYFGWQRPSGTGLLLCALFTALAAWRIVDFVRYVEWNAPDLAWNALTDFAEAEENRAKRYPVPPVEAVTVALSVPFPREIEGEETVDMLRIHQGHLRIGGATVWTGPFRLHEWEAVSDARVTFPYFVLLYREFMEKADAARLAGAFAREDREE
jgi:hypothetical protein